MKVKKKERKNESYDLWLATSKEKGKESRQVVGKAGWLHNGTVCSFFEFVCLAMYLLNLHWQQQEKEWKWENLHFLRLYKIQPSLLTCVF